MKSSFKLFALFLFLISFTCSRLSAQIVDWITPISPVLHGVTYDQFDNSFAIGSFTNTVTVGSNSYTSAGLNDVIVTKLDASGNIIWATAIGSNLADYPGDIVFDGVGNVWITGETEGNLVAGSFNLTSNGQGDPFVVKLNAATGAVLFAANGGGSADDDGNDISTDGAGNIYLLGDCRSTNFSWGSFNMSTAGGVDVFLLKLNNAGVPQWLSSIRGPSTENAYCATADAAGNSYIAGTALSATINFNSTSVTGNGNHRFIAKFDDNGNYVWSALGTGGGNLYDIAVDNVGNTYFTGAGGASTWGNTTLPAVPPGNGVDILIGKVNANGTFSWAQFFGGLGYAEGTGLDCDNAGNVFLVGRFTNFLNVGGINLSTYGANAARGIVAKIDSSGSAIWAMESRAGTGFQFFRDIRVNSSNNIFITGSGGNYIALGTDSIPLTLGFVVRLADSANEVRGKVFADANNDGIMNTNEIGILHAVLQLNAGSYYNSSNVAGDYRFYTQSGSQSVSLPNVPLYHTITTAATQSANFTGLGAVDTGNNFGLYPMPNMNDLRIDLTAINKPKPGNILAYKVSYKNTGTTTQNVTVNMQSDLNLTFSSSNLTPTSQAGATTTWNIGSLAPQTYGAFNVYFTVPTSMQIGNPLTTSATANPTSNDQTPLDNTSSSTNLVVGPFDPNYKAVDIDTIYDLNGASYYLTYEVHFQNVGNAPAENVLIIDTILSSYLDMSTIELMSSSHVPVNMNLEKNNVSKFYFPAIQLPDSNTNLLGSMGFVKFRIKQNGTLPVDSTIDNFADIYFDYNAAIRTNTATTVHLISTALAETSFENTPIVYPNPSTGHFKIDLGKMYEDLVVTLTDFNGRIIKTASYGNGQLLTLNIEQPSGIYLLQIMAEGKKATVRVINK